MTTTAVVRSAWAALLAPKRLVPILGVTIPLLWAQRVYSWSPDALWVGLALCLVFVLVAPVSYRALFEGPLDVWQGVVRIVLFAAIGAGVVFAFGLYLPHLFGIESTFMTARGTLVIDVALFLAGGWGLGRDVALEASLDRERKRAEDLARVKPSARSSLRSRRTSIHIFSSTRSTRSPNGAGQDGVAAERAVLELASLLREVLEGIDAPSWPLSRELDVCKTLLSLHRMRDPRSLHRRLANRRRSDARASPSDAPLHARRECGHAWSVEGPSR